LSIEAVKMETAGNAERDGIVADIATRVGALVGVMD